MTSAVAVLTIYYSIIRGGKIQIASNLLLGEYTDTDTDSFIRNRKAKVNTI